MRAFFGSSWRQLVRSSPPQRTAQQQHLLIGIHARAYGSHRFPSERIPVGAIQSPTSSAKRKWVLVPVSGSIIVAYLIYSRRRRKQSNILLLDSPHIIPTSPTHLTPSFAAENMMSSFNEPHPSLVDRIAETLRDWIWEPICTGVRFVELCVYFFPVIFTAPMLLVGEPHLKFDGDRWGAVWWYGFLTRQMQRAGPTFIKLAQWAASRADLFPQHLCDRLGTLHSTTKPHSFSFTRRVIERIFQRPFDEVFETFDPTPIGSGAIAQVYRATLRKDLLPPSYLDPKRKRSTRFPRTLAATEAIVDTRPPPPVIPTSDVAVKVLHPRVARKIRRDLSIMGFFAHCVSIIPGMQWISLPEEVDVFGAMMREQLDLRLEARNLNRFETNFGARRENAVNFPRPLTEYTTNEVLIEEYEDALPLNVFLRNGGGPFDDTLATLGLDVFLNMLLLDNFTHADLHPGNIMIKFYKPTTTFVLKNMLSSILGTSSPKDPLQGSQAASETSDHIVASLRPLKNQPEEWRRELEKLSLDGYQPELVLLDAGLVTVLGDEDRRNFLDLFRAIAEFDGYRAGQLMAERCRTPQMVIDKEVFALKIQHLALSVKSKTFSLGQIRISDVLHEVLKAVQAHHVKMEGDFVNTIVSILLLEGIGRQLDPNLDLFKSALPILRKLGRQMTPSDVKHDAQGIGAMLKFWVWIEARQLANSAFQDADDFMRYDWMTPNI